MPPKSYRYNAVSNRFSSRFSTSLTNALRLLSQTKASTHSPSPTGSHTRAHTAKQGPSLPRPQHGFALPVKFLLFCHALYTYISRFSVDSHYQQREKIRQSCRHKFYPQLFLVAFSTSRTNGSRLLSRVKAGNTLAFAQKIAHNVPHGETGGASDGGGITTLGAFHTFRKPCVAGYQNGVLCRFWVLARGTPEERREPSEQRCAYARRCSEASRPCWAA